MTAKREMPGPIVPSPADDVREALCWETVSPLGDTRRCRNRARAGMATCAVHASSEEALAWRVEEAKGELHAGYLQLHELVKDAPDGVRRAVGNDPQRVLANGSFSLHPSMLRHLLIRAYEQGLAHSASSLAPAAEVRPRGTVTDAEVGAAFSVIPWGFLSRQQVRTALEAAREVQQ